MVVVLGKYMIIIRYLDPKGLMRCVSGTPESSNRRHEVSVRVVPKGSLFFGEMSYFQYAVIHKKGYTVPEGARQLRNHSRV